MATAREIAEALLKISAVRFSTGKPFVFKSGRQSPIYVDNRTLPYYGEWHKVIEGFSKIAKNLDFEILAGVEAGGIPHSAALGFFMNIPSVFVRKQTKDHGTGKLVEGGEVKGKKVLLVEDLVTTGSSALAGIEKLRAEGAIVTDCLSIVSYGFKEAEEAFAKANVRLHVLTTFTDILARARENGELNAEQLKTIAEWLTQQR